MQINAPTGAEQRMGSGLADQLQRQRKKKRQEKEAQHGDRLELSDAAKVLAEAIDSAAPLMSHIRAWYLPDANSFNQQLINSAANNIITSAATDGLRLNRELIEQELSKQYPAKSHFAPYFVEELTERLPFYRHILGDKQFIPALFLSTDEKVLLEQLHQSTEESDLLAQVNHLALICCLAKWSAQQKQKKMPTLGTALLDKLQQGLQQERFHQLFSIRFLQHAQRVFEEYLDSGDQQKNQLG